MKKTFILSAILLFALGFSAGPKEVDASFYCDPSVETIEVGDTVVWSVTESIEDGSVSYSWSGSDGLSGSSSSVSKTYNSSGYKNASVTISSGSSSISQSCAILVIEPEENEDLTGSCSVSPSNPDLGDSVTWSATASGGDGDYTYSWSGTDGLSSSSRVTFHRYYSDGLKNGSVTITSDGESITKNCSVFVEDEEEEEDDLELYCTPDGGTYEVDERVIWQAHASGGDGGYTYDWSGTDGLDGNSRTESIRYDDDGTKRAYVTVHSRDGQSESANCRIFVEEEDDDDFEISCEVSDTRIEEGDRVTFEVEIDGGDSPYDIEWDGDIDDIDGFDDNDRRQTVRIDDAGRYEIEVEVTDDDGRRETDQCRTIIVDDEDDDTNVTVTSSTITGQVAGVALSQVPVTGLTDNPVLDAILYSLAGLTLLVIGTVSLFILKKRQVVPASGYAGNDVVSALEDVAHDKKVIISSDAMDSLVLKSDNDKKKAISILNSAIDRAKKGISTDAWIVLTKQKLTENS